MNLSNAASQKLQKIFDEIDSVENDKHLNLDEIVTCLEKLNIKLSEEDIAIFMASDIDNDGQLSFEEFCDFTQHRLRKLFTEIDSNGNGYLDVAEIQTVCQKLGVAMSARQIESILAEMDSDSDGQVDFIEFCEFFADMPSPDLQQMTQKWMYGEGLDIGSDMTPAALPPKEIPLARFMIAGGLAGIVSRTATAPLETLKLIAQTSSTGRTKLSHTFKAILEDGGIRGLFNGNLTNCIRVFPTSAVACIVYSQMIQSTPVDSAKNPNQALWRFFSGCSAGIIGTSFTHPLDVVRARLTVQLGAYSGIYNCISRIFAEEGARGLFKGLSPTLLTIGPFMGIQQSVYDIMKLKLLSDVSNPYVFLACGALAGTVAQTVVHPLDVLRRQMQVSKSKTSLSEMSSRLWRQGGLRRLFAGLTPAYLKVVPAASISLLVRDAILGRIN